MPYLSQVNKDITKQNGFAYGAGALNYLITLQCKNYIDKNGLSYGTINDVVGALTCAKDEFYRRVAVPYEDEKIKTNGDVY